MRTFLLGLSIVYAALAAAALKDFSPRALADPWPRGVVIAVLLIPLLTGWATAELIRGLRGSRLRIFNRSRPRPVARFIFGVTAGTLGAALALVSLMLIPNPPSDAVAMAAGSAIGTAVVLMFARRTRPSCCPACDYDLRNLTPAARGLCPECGLALAYASGPSHTPPESPSISDSTLVRA